MAYIDLSRSFVAISKDAEPDLTLGEVWGRKYGGWLKWSDLLDRPRVVLLAEASSGKTEEFKNTAAALRANGSPAFFIPIEQLSQGSIEGALGPDANLFAAWKSGSSTAWFFLDAVDEARLVHKEFDAALRRFAGELGTAVGRARVLVSCRVSDWRGRADRESIEQVLPSRAETAVEQSTQDDDAALLDPVFDRKERRKLTDKDDDKQERELLVVQLAPLNNDQRRLLAASARVRDADEFVEAIERHGLDALAERPGDVLDLASYWNLHGRFGSLAEMTDHGIQAKLAELNKYRPDNSELALQQARQGAERIAAALTLGKSFTVLAPGYEPDPTYSAGALDPEAILEEWTYAERNALLRRGVFAPSTYGRIRFHHRSTQEFLTAAWLNRLLKAGLPRQLLFNLLFAERYGVKTIVPSLRPVAAWLAQDHVDVRDEAIRREPFVLLNYGDAGTLPLPIKQQLLLHLAHRHADGGVAHNIERRALWMFASPDLADAAREAWEVNPHSDFRADLVRLIGEGHITGCIDLAASVAESGTEGPYYRILGLVALKECRAHSALKKVAHSLLQDPSRLSPRLYGGFVEILFPEHLSVAEFLASLESAQMPSPHTSYGSIWDSFSEMWNRCPVATRPEFIAGLADLCLREPHVDHFERVSKKYHELAKHIASIAIRAMDDLGDRQPSDSLIRLLSVVERADHGRHVDDDTPLSELVRQNSQVNRALFWHDVADQRAHRSDDRPEVVSVWQIHFGGTQLWELSTHDLPWLYADLSERPKENDRRIALSAILSIHSRDNTLSENVAALRARIGTQSVLQADIDSFLVPPPENEERKKETKQRAAKLRRKREADKRSWIELRRDLQATPSVLYDPQGVLKGKALNGLLNLTNWLRFKSHKDYEGAARRWPLLQEGFGLAVAHAYRDGMKILWRAAKAEAPKREPGAPVTTKWTTVLAFAGVGIEADEDRAWAAKLTPSEALRAAEHGCISDQGYPDWIHGLLEHHESTVLPVVSAAFLAEWMSEEHGSLNFLHHYGSPASSIPSAVRTEVFRIISRHEPKRPLVLDYGLRLLCQLVLTPMERQALQKLAKTRLRKHAAGRPDWADRYLAMFFLVNPAKGVGQLALLLAQTSPEDRRATAERVLGTLFGGRHSLVPISLTGAPVHALEGLAALAYKVRPEDDNVHQEGTYSPNAPDKVESGRAAILLALLDATGEEAYKAVLRLAEAPEIKPRRLRFLELAHRMAERDAETEAWHPDDVASLERQHTLPIRTAAGLYSVVLEVLDEVTWSFEHADASSRGVLESARDEDAVQNWLAEQLALRANDRYHVQRETEVAFGNLPDITVASTTSAFEVAIEVKHGGKNWTATTLKDALRNQLAEGYLKPPNRRHGIFVVTHHRGRTWHHPKTKERMSFAQLVAHLRTIASRLKANTVGEISIDVRGIDASPRVKKRNGTKSKRVPKRKRKSHKATAQSVS